MELSFKTNIKNWLDKLEPLEPEDAGLCPNLKKGKPIKAVIFDIYGTLLISSSGDIDQATFTEENMKEALVAGGFKPDSFHTGLCAFLLKELPKKVASNQKETLANGHPFPDVDIFKVWDEMFIEAENRKLLQRKGNESMADTIIVFEILSNKVAPMPGLKEVLEALKAKNIPLGIVSNAQFYTPIIMNYFLTGEFSTTREINYFEPELTAFSYTELRAKPDVELFRKILPGLQNSFKVKPHEAIFVGNDMLKDIYTANQAGMQTALFAGDKRSLRLRENDERVRGLTPDYTLTDLKQILTIIDA